MICNKCGQDNPDDARLCLSCGHKLQSGFRGSEEGEGWPGEPIPLLRETDVPGAGRGPRLAEVWAVAACAGLGVWFFIQWRMEWGAYALTGLAVLYAWLRGITWED
jgi:hypothetical protein